MPFRNQALDAVTSVWRSVPAGFRHAILRATNARFLVGVLGIVQDDADQLLVLEHRFRVPWAWGLPGGFLQRGETPEQGLARELREETGLELEVESEVLDTHLNSEAGYLSLTLKARARSTDGLRFSDEITGGGFFPANALPKDLYPRHRVLIERVLARSSP